jgi:hypothetical protein
MFRIGENLLGGRTPAQSFRIVQGESPFGRSPAQFTAERFGIQAGGTKNGAQSPHFPQKFFQHFVPVGSVFGNKLKEIEVNHFAQTKQQVSRLNRRNFCVTRLELGHTPN